MIYDNFDLNALKIFVSVFENNSISIASKKLYISQPAVTISIQKLEERLGGKLFVRLPKGIKPTMEGKRFYNYCKNALNQVSLGIQNFSEISYEQTGTINIGADTSVIKYILAPLLRKFSKQYPHIKVSFTEVIAERLQKYLARGDIDIAFELSPIKNMEAFENIKLRELTNCIVVNATSKIKHFSNDMLKEQKLAVLKKNSNHRALFDDICLKNGLDITPFYETANFESLIQICKHADAVGFAVKELIENDLKYLKVVATDLVLPKTELFALLPKGDNNSFACDKFLSLFAKF